MLLANKDAPTGIKCIDRPAKKYPPTLPRFLHEDFKIIKFQLKYDIWCKIHLNQYNTQTPKPMTSAKYPTSDI